MLTRIILYLLIWLIIQPAYLWFVSYNLVWPREHIDELFSIPSELIDSRDILSLDGYALGIGLLVNGLLLLISIFLMLFCTYPILAIPISLFLVFIEKRMFESSRLLLIFLLILNTVVSSITFFVFDILRLLLGYGGMM